MRFVCLVLMLLAFSAAGNPAFASGHLAAARPQDGRVGVLPQAWVEALERNNVSERTALLIGGVTAAAIGVGAVAGTSAGSTTGAALLVLWLAQWPLRIALTGGVERPRPAEPAPRPRWTAPRPTIQIGF